MSRIGPARRSQWAGRGHFHSPFSSRGGLVMPRSFTGFVGPGSVRRQSTDRRRLSLERLEDRATPAGNVLAIQAGAFLMLTGDDLANNVLLLPGSAPNEIVVQGVDTTINGSTDPQTFTGVSDLDAELLGGDDQLIASGIVIDVPSFP